MEPDYHFLEALKFNEKRKSVLKIEDKSNPNKLQNVLFLKSILLEKTIPTLTSKDETFLAKNELFTLQSELYNAIEKNIVRTEKDQPLAAIDKEKLKKALNTEKLKNKAEKFSDRILLCESNSEDTEEISNTFSKPSQKSVFGAKMQKSDNKDVLGDEKSDNAKALHPSLKGCDERLVEAIRNEIMDSGSKVEWDDIIGLDFQKKAIKEIVIWPILRPDIFKGLRGPPKGVLLFGPPGTGKTLIGKAIASEAGAKFFSISASSLTSKWHGEGEKLVKTLFAVAASESPAIIFVDEIDSLLSQRSSDDFEATRRLKTEFLVQLDGVRNTKDERVLMIGATNRPHELDEAARRRLIKRLYIPLPDERARGKMVNRLLENETKKISESEMAVVIERTNGFSGADIAALCREASYGPIRSLGADIEKMDSSSVRPIEFRDFEEALRQTKASVAENDLKGYAEWNERFGCGMDKN